MRFTSIMRSTVSGLSRSNRRVDRLSRVGYREIDALETRNDFGDDTIDGGSVGDVRSKDLRDSPGPRAGADSRAFAQRFDIATDQRDVGAETRELHRDRATDATTASGDQRRPSGKVHTLASARLSIACAQLHAPAKSLTTQRRMAIPACVS